MRAQKYIHILLIKITKVTPYKYAVVDTDNVDGKSIYVEQSRVMRPAVIPTIRVFSPEQMNFISVILGSARVGMIESLKYMVFAIPVEDEIEVPIAQFCGKGSRELAYKLESRLNGRG